MAVHCDHSAQRDLESFEEEIIHEFHMIAEEWSLHIRRLAEDVTKLNEKLDLMRLELTAEIGRAFRSIAQAFDNRDDGPEPLSGN
jgi:hypothetical protein